MKAFTQDPPQLVGFVVCEGVAVTIGTGRATLIGLFDVIVGSQYPASLDGSIVAIFSGVRETFECNFQAMGFGKGEYFGARTDIATVTVQPPEVGT